MKKLFKLALVAGGVTFVGKMLAAKKQEWAGLTEPEVRSKLDTKLSDRVPADKKREIADKVVSTMRDKQLLGDELPISESGDAPGV